MEGSICVSQIKLVNCVDKYSLYLPIYAFVVLSIVEKVIIESPNIIDGFLISPFSFVTFCVMYFGAFLLHMCIFIVVIFSIILICILQIG